MRGDAEMHKQSWLGNRIVWHSTTCEGAHGRAARVVFRRERLPWLTSGKMVTAFISHKEFTLRFFDTQRLDALESSLCFFTTDRNALSLSSLAEFLEWPGSEAVFSEYTGLDLAEMNPSDLFTNQIVKRWSASKVPGWYLIDRGPAGISFVSEMAEVSSGQKRAVELSDHWFAAYKEDLLKSSAFTAQDQIVCLRIHQLEMGCLKRLMSTDDAITVRQIARMFRYWLYQEAVSYDLPF